MATSTLQITAGLIHIYTKPVWLSDTPKMNVWTLNPIVFSVVFYGSGSLL